jgi:hypothetical protein
LRLFATLRVTGKRDFETGFKHVYKFGLGVSRPRAVLEPSLRNPLKKWEYYFKKALVFFSPSSRAGVMPYRRRP